MNPALHITGASGSGTTTLARALADRLGLTAIDTDDHYWAKTDPPYQTARPVEERLLRLAEVCVPEGGWVLSGSLGRWADPLKGSFSGVIFLWVPEEVRIERLRRRERETFGAEALGPGGAMRDNHTAFLGWARSYDAGPETMRSRAFHEQWLASLTCPVLRLEGEAGLVETTGRSVAWCARLSSGAC